MTDPADPFGTPLADPLAPAQLADSQPAPPAPSLDAPSLDAPSLDMLSAVPIRLQAVLGRRRMTLAQIASFTPGQIVELDRRVGEPVDILANDCLVARGEVVMVDGVLGVTVTELASDATA